MRHDALQWALIWVLRRLRGHVAAVGKMDMFGSAARAEAGRALHADIVAYHWRSPGRHLWVDVAITTPDTREAFWRLARGMCRGRRRAYGSLKSTVSMVPRWIGWVGVSGRA